MRRHDGRTGGGPASGLSASERARRQSRLQEVESLFDPLPLDAAAARSFGAVVAAVATTGRSHRSRLADLLIAAVAHAHHLPLYTRNPADVEGLASLIGHRGLSLAASRPAGLVRGGARRYGRR